MPKGHHGHGPRRFIAERMWLFPALERTPDLSRGELRLAGEVVMAMLRGDQVPRPVKQRALAILNVLANG